MINIISAGHPQGGGANGILNETVENRKVVKEIKKLNTSIQDVSCEFSMSANEELNYKVKKVNDICRNQKVNCYADIHFNSHGNPDANGAEIWVLAYETGLYSNRESFNSNVSKAQKVLNEIVAATGLSNRGIKYSHDFAVLRNTNCHSMLIEVCFISSPEDCKKYEPVKVAKAIVKGLGEEVSSIPTPNPEPLPPSNIDSSKYVHLKSHMTSWAVYPLDKQPIKANACGYLNPSAYGGLDYKILGNPQTDVYTIQTSNFGKVNIYIPVDGDSNFYDKPVITPPIQSNRSYLNIHPHVPSWRVYPLNKPATVGNECGSLAPAQFSGLSYEIIENKGDVKVIHTQSFGKVQIYAPRDNDSSITTSPIY